MIYGTVFSLVVVFAFVLNALYKRTNHFNNQFVDVKKYWKPNLLKQNLDIVNLGSNHPKFGLDYSECSLAGENLAIGPQTFEYDFAVLRHNIYRLSKNATVLIPVCLLKFFLYRQSSRDIHTKYYTFLPPKDTVGYSFFEKAANVMLPLLFHPQRLRYLVKDVKKDKRMDFIENPNASEEFLKNDAEKWMKCWEREFDISFDHLHLSKKKQKDIQMNIDVLENMLAYCVQHELKPVILILPVTEYLSSQFSDEFLKNHILAYIDKANIVNAPILNYLKDERFIAPEYYINSFFMNRAGARKFTKVVINDLGKL